MPTFHRFGRFAAIPLIVFAIVGAVLLVEQSRDAGAAGPCSASDAALDGEELAFIAALNGYRAQNSLTALATSPALTNGAAWMASDLPGNPVFDHTDTLGRSAAVRAADCGFPGAVGENIAAGTDWDTGAEAFAAWQSSPGHNANMLGGSYAVVGVARHFAPGSTYGWYWVAMFGVGPDGSTPSPTSTTPAATPTTPGATPTTPGATPTTPAATPTTPAATATTPAATATPPANPNERAGGGTASPTPGNAAPVAGAVNTPPPAELPPMNTPPAPTATASPANPPGDPRLVPASAQDLPRIPRGPIIQLNSDGRP